MKTNPNQKIVRVKKAVYNKDNIYMITNIKALEYAAKDLKAGAFKLWIYFSSNQPDYKFALSNKAVADSFGIKKDQYDSAVKELEEKGYLYKYNDGETTWRFSEIPLPLQEKTTTKEKENKSVVGKNHNAVVVKNHKGLQEKTTTKSGKKPQEIIQDNTINNINNNTPCSADKVINAYYRPLFDEFLQTKKEKGSQDDPIPVTSSELQKYNITMNNFRTENGLLVYQEKYFKPVKETFSF